MPSSISTLRCEALPSSSTLSEPRRSGMVPSSSTVTPLAATRWPMRPAKALRALAVEVAFQPVADGLVQQHAGPARAEHDGHLAGRRRARFEVGQRGVHGLVDIALDHLVVEIAEAEAAAAAAGADFAAHSPSIVCSAITVTDRRTSGRTSAASVPSARATSTTSYSPASAGHHLHDARVLARARASRPSRAAPPSACCRAWRSGRSARTARGWRRRCGFAPTLTRGSARRRRCVRTVRAASSSAASEMSSRVGEGGLLAGHGAHAHALVDAEAAALDDAFLQAPALAARVLEVEVGVVDAVRGDGLQRGAQRALRSGRRAEQQRFGQGQAFEGGFAGDHSRSL